MGYLQKTDSKEKPILDWHTLYNEISRFYSTNQKEISKIHDGPIDLDSIQAELFHALIIDYAYAKQGKVKLNYILAES